MVRALCQEEPDEMEDEPSANGEDGRQSESGAAMRNVVQQLVRSIAGSARGRAEATAVLNGRDGADQEDAPSTDGGNGRRPDRGGVAGAKSAKPRQGRG